MLLGIGYVTVLLYCGVKDLVAGERHMWETGGKGFSSDMASRPSSNPLQSPPMVDPNLSDSLPNHSFASIAQTSNHSSTHSSNLLFDEKTVTLVCTVKEFEGTPILVFSLEDTKSLVESLKLALFVWCELPGLPAHLFQHSALFHIGKMTGKPLQVDSHTASHSRLSKAHLCVEIDLCKDRKAVYDYVPPFCVLCSHVGHHKDDCYTYGGKLHPSHRFAATTPKNMKGMALTHDDGASEAAAPRKLKIAKAPLCPDLVYPIRDSDVGTVYNLFGPLALTVYHEDQEEGKIVDTGNMSEGSASEGSGSEDSGLEGSDDSLS
ncbi:hypothetical protein ACS0TY_033679 [Phlomoides rotata]